jgi:hypothetical protein
MMHVKLNQLLDNIKYNYERSQTNNKGCLNVVSKYLYEMFMQMFN